MELENQQAAEPMEPLEPPKTESMEVAQPKHAIPATIATDDSDEASPRDVTNCQYF